MSVNFTAEEKKVFSRIGIKGGASTSKKKIAASKKNAALARAARTPRYPPCVGGYANGSHRFAPNGRCYSKKCRDKYPDLKQKPKGE